MKTFIYHERQLAALCGQHALNNLLQKNHFDPSSLYDIAHALDQEELRIMGQNDEGGKSSKNYLQRLAEGSGNVDESGNYSIQVLGAALENIGISLSLRHPKTDTSYGSHEDDVTVHDGFICNRHAHWFTIRKLNDRFWNLNSMAEKPELISHFRLAAEITALQTGGYDVFYVTKGSLPQAFVVKEGEDFTLKEAERDHLGPLTYWWKEEVLMKQNSSAKAMDSDPWANLSGAGRRMDGNSSSSGSGSDVVDLTAGTGDLSEEDQIALAIAASLSPADDSSSSSNDNNSSNNSNNNNNNNNNNTETPLELQPEPEEANPNRVKIQFRLPDGCKKVRHFDHNWQVSQLYAYVSAESGISVSQLELRGFYPAKNINLLRDQTISEAALRGESITVRKI